MIINGKEYTKNINGKEYKYHHSATHRGYQSVKGSTFEKYDGRFGKGYTEHINDPRSTYYHTVIYWIEREVNNND